MNTVVVAVDGSRASREAVELGVELAEEHRAEVVLVHVIPQMHIVPLNGFGLVGGVRHEPTPAELAILEDAKTIAELREIRVRTKLLCGDIVDEIVAYADNIDADMIVIGSRGRGTLAGALLGSVSRGVLAESKRPVAVVRDSDPAGTGRGLARAC